MKTWANLRCDPRGSQDGSTWNRLAPLVGQEKPYSCGLAALRSVLGLLGAVTPSESTLARLAGTSKQGGTSPEGIAKAAQALGFRADIRENSDLAALPRGAILSIQYKDPDSWDDGHYVVLEKIEGDEVTVMDPADPPRHRKLKVAALEKLWHDEDAGGLRRRKLAIVVSAA